VFRDFPLEAIHSNAFRAAEAANCAGEQGKYWEMHDLLFENQDQLDITNLKEYAARLRIDVSQFEGCLASGKYADEIRHDIEDGKKYYVEGTPTFFVNGHRLAGPSLDQLQQTIDSVLKEVR
jgi:protein-disulfide isomerase